MNKRMFIVAGLAFVDLHAGFPVMQVTGNGHQTRLRSNARSIPKPGIEPALSMPMNRLPGCVFGRS